MEAKEIKELIEKARNRNGDGLVDHKYLAEISFKAGIREVVDAVFNESYGDPRITGYIHIKWDEWQAKLKEWGIY